MRLIGISGKIGTGKTTLAKALLRQNAENGVWAKRAFADALKEEAAARFDFPLTWAYEAKGNVVSIGANAYPHKAPKARMSVREILQWWGTDVKRAEDPNYWDNRLYHWIMDRWLPGRTFVVDDVRFPSEARLIRDMGGLLVRLEPFPGWSCDPEIAAHLSETALDEWGAWDIQVSCTLNYLENLLPYRLVALLDERSQEAA